MSTVRDQKVLSQESHKSVWEAISTLTEQVKRLTTSVEKSEGAKKSFNPNFRKEPYQSPSGQNRNESFKKNIVFDNKRAKPINCFKCGQNGHMKRDCQSKTEERTQNNFAPFRNEERRFKSSNSQRSNWRNQPQGRGNQDWRNQPQQARYNQDRYQNDRPSTSTSNVVESEIEQLRKQNTELTERLLKLEQAETSKVGVVKQRKLPIIPVCFGDNQTDALIDTGSDITLISLEFANNVLGLDFQRCAPVSICKTASCSDLAVFGEISLKFKIGNQFLEEKFSVVEKSPFSIIFGGDFIYKHSVVPNIRCGSVTINSEKLQIESRTYKTSKQSSTTTYVCLIKPIYIPARSEIVTTAQIMTNWTHWKKGEHAIFEPNQDLCASKLLYLASTLVNTSCRSIPVRLLNVHNKPINLKAGVEIGRLEECINQDVFQFNKGSQENVTQLTKELEGCFHKANGSEEERQMSVLKDLLIKNWEVFSCKGQTLGRTHLVEHRIETENQKPVKSKQFRIPFRQKEELKKIVDDMKEDGIVIESKSPWSANMFLVKKKDGTLRPVVDYRGLNAISKTDVYPLPRIEDCLDSLAGAQFFSTLDLKSGYWQIAMHPESQEKTAFTTPFGHYEFTVMPFGVKNAPADFQRIMEIALSGLQWRSCLVYIDDILIYSKNFDDHIQHLKAVFLALKKANLRVKPEKCTFLRSQVPYLGHIISKEGVRPDPAKVSAILDAEAPRTVRQLQAFLGLVQWFRRFVPNLAQTADILYKLTNKSEKFFWKENHQKAFLELKEAFVSPPVLCYPIFDNTAKFTLTTDASNNAIGAILGQTTDARKWIIAYASRSLNKAERNYATVEKEALAIVWATKYFRHYLYGSQFTNFTDHRPLQWLLNLKDPSSRLMRWALKLQEFDFEIKYLPGKENSGADWLSREVSSHILAEPETNFSTEAEKDEFIQEIKTKLALKNCTMEIRNEFDVFKGTLVRRYRPKRSSEMIWQTVVPKTCIRQILTELHDSEFSAHFGIARTVGKVLQRYWWPTLTKDIENWCQSCEICLQRKSPGHTPKAPLRPLPVEGTWDRVAVDCLEYPISRNNNRYVIVFMDYLTKWVEAFPIPNLKAATVVNIFVKEIVCRFGTPRQLLSDRGSNFTSQLMRDVCKQLEIHKIFTTAYHPETDGLVERFNRTLSAALATLVSREPSKWDEYVAYVLFAYCACQQESTGFSPFLLMFGREPRFPIEILTKSPERTVYSEEQFLKVLQESLKDYREKAALAIEKAQKKQKIQYDKGTQQIEYSVGDTVYLKKGSLAIGEAHKLAMKWQGPYRITEVVSETNVRIEFVADPRVIKLVHVNRLKRSKEADSNVRPKNLVGDKVFAKVVGHPFWPAKGCTFSDFPSKVGLDYNKIPVLFYGHKKTFGLCEPVNVLDFAENLNKFILCRRKGHSDALQMAMKDCSTGPDSITKKSGTPGAAC